MSPEVTAGNIADFILDSLKKLSKKSVANLLEARYNKFRKIGVFEEEVLSGESAPEENSCAPGLEDTLPAIGEVPVSDVVVSTEETGLKDNVL